MRITLNTFRTPLSKFVIKTGLAAGAVYYISEQGVWKSSNETTKLYGRISENLKPYLQQAKGQLPIEIPDLPSTNKVSYLTKQYWNRGVSATFTFLGNLPDHTTTWTKKGIEAASSNAEIKKFIDSFSSTPEPPRELQKK